MDIENKIDKSKNYCHIGFYRESFSAVIDIIPLEIIEKISAQELGKLIQAIWNSWKKTKQLRDAEIIADECVWDEANKRLIELCQS